MSSRDNCRVDRMCYFSFDGSVPATTSATTSAAAAAEQLRDVLMLGQHCEAVSETRPRATTIQLLPRAQYRHCELNVRVRGPKNDSNGRNNETIIERDSSRLYARVIRDIRAGKHMHSQLAR